MWICRKKLVVFFVAMLLAVTLVVGCAGSDNSNNGSNDDGNEEPGDTPNVIKVGALVPLTGDDALDGQNQRHAHDLAIEEINAAGGIAALGGAKIELVYGDSQGRPEIGNAETERLITNENVVAILGAYHSGVTVSAQRIAERYGVPFIVPNALSNEITELGMKYTFKTVPRSSDYARDTGELVLALNSMFGTDAIKVAVLHADNFIGSQMGEGWAEWLPQQGFDVVETIAFPPTATNMQSEILRIRAADPDVILSQANAKEAVLIVKTMQELDYWPKYGLIGAGGGYSTPDVMSSLGESSEGLYLVNDWFPASARPGSEEANVSFREKYGVDMTGNANTTYAGTWLLAEALEKTGSTDREALANTLRTATFEHPNILFMYDRIEFGEDGMNLFANNVAAQIRDGRPIVVWPEQAAIAEPVWPVLHWDQR